PACYTKSLPRGPCETDARTNFPTHCATFPDPAAPSTPGTSPKPTVRDKGNQLGKHTSGFVNA
ncbi:hypothetical protein BaRGS_00034988, partial [Batillaria attramentaria]